MASAVETLEAAARTVTAGWPRVMVDIIKEMVLFDQETFWLKPKYLRRGRLVEAVATNLASGLGVEEAWWSRHSGEGVDDRVDHEECRPYAEAAAQWLNEMGFVLEHHQVEVVNPVLRCIGHLDWDGYFKHDQDRHKWIIDLKCGPPPPEYSGGRRNPLFDAYHFQTALYKLGRASQDSTYAIAKRAGLHLFDGRYQFVPHNNPRDLIIAPKLAEHWHFRQQYKGVN